MQMNSIGERLREERTRLGFNQVAFGAIGGVQKLAQLKYEKGDRIPDAAYLEAIAKVNADIQYIVTGVRSSATLSADESDLLERFRAASLEVKGVIIRALSGDTDKGTKSITVSAPGGQAAGRDMTIKKKS